MDRFDCIRELNPTRIVQEKQSDLKKERIEPHTENEQSSASARTLRSFGQCRDKLRTEKRAVVSGRGRSRCRSRPRAAALPAPSEVSAPRWVAPGAPGLVHPPVPVSPKGWRARPLPSECRVKSIDSRTRIPHPAPSPPLPSWYLDITSNFGESYAPRFVQPFRRRVVFRK